MNIHKNARTDAAQSSRDGAARARCVPDAHGGRDRHGRLAADRRQVGGALPGRRRGRPRRPLLAPAPAARPTPPDDGRADRGAAPPALDRQADRRRRWALARYRQPGAARASASAGCSDLEPARARAPLRARPSRRADPYRHQEARPLRARRPPHHRRSRRAQRRQRPQQGVGWEFVHVCIDDASRIAFSQILPDEKKGKRRRLPPRRHRLLRRPRHHRRPAS